MYMKLCFDTLLKLSFPMTSQITIFLILLALLHPRGIGGGGGGGDREGYTQVTVSYDLRARNMTKREGFPCGL